MRFQSVVLRRSLSRLLVTSILCSSFSPAFAGLEDDDNDAPAVVRAVPIVVPDDLKQALMGCSFAKGEPFSLEEQKALLPAVKQLWSKLSTDQRATNGSGHSSAYRLFNVLSLIDISEREHVLKCALPFLRDGACDVLEVCTLLHMLSKIEFPLEREIAADFALPIWERLGRLGRSYAPLAFLCVEKIKQERLKEVTAFMFRMVEGIEDTETRLLTFRNLINFAKDLSDKEMVQLEKDYHAVLAGEKENVVENQNTSATQGASQNSGCVWSWLRSWFWKK